MCERNEKASQTAPGWVSLKESDLMALHAQVARLEAELKQARADGLLMVRDNDKAYAANAALTAELKEWLQAPLQVRDGVMWKDASGLIASTDVLLAALSDLGEGWPEGKERMMAAGERVWKHYGLASWAIYKGKREEAEVAREFRAALDALGGTK